MIDRKEVKYTVSRSCRRQQGCRVRRPIMRTFRAPGSIDDLCGQLILEMSILRLSKRMKSSKY
jgi:hypothetical protein